jgi:hypothetical protein
VVEAGENDAEVVFERLVSAAAAAAAADAVDGGVGAVVYVLRRIEGPFAFVFYDAVGGRVYFGRDRLGRRSLLVRDLRGGGMVLCSVAGEGHGGEGWREVEADGVYVVKVGGGGPPQRCGWVVGEGADDFVSTLGWLRCCVLGCGRLSCQTYSTSCRSPALAGSTRRCRRAVAS